MSLTNQNDQGDLTKKPASVLDMPLDVADLVFEHLNSRQLLNLRHVCRDMRAAVEKSGIKFGSINCEVQNRRTFINQKSGGVRYSDDIHNGGSLITNNQGQKADSENFMKLATRDLKPALMVVRSLKIYNATKDGGNIIKSFINFLKPDDFFPVKKIELINFSFNDFVTILPYFEAKTLEKIDLMSTPSVEQFERITYLDQWKKTKLVNILYSQLDSKLISHFFHFSSFRAYISDFPTATALEIRDDLMKRKTFKECQIHYKTPASLTPIEILKVFEPDFSAPNSHMHTIDYSNDNNNFEIRCGYTHTSTYNYFYVTRL